MKVETLAGNAQKSRFGDSDTKKFGIAEEAHGLIMKYLTDLYDDPILAAIRETISNGIDAHKAAGTSKKVQITVSSPGDTTSFFQITDYGVGMSREILTDVYTQYGVSTKRDDDEAIGGFGLGCKSPLAIEDRFYLETTQDGLTIVAEIYKNNGGEFRLDINDEYQSGKPNGTTVRINLEKTSIYSFRDKLAQFLTFVNPDLYELKTTNSSDTYKPEYALGNKEKYHLITDTGDFQVYANLKPEYDERQKIVMGEVAYNFNIPQSVFSRTKLDRESLKVVIVAPINSVTITTSRENTQDTKKTKTFLEKVYLKFEEDINEYFQNYVDGAETPLDVYKRVHEAQRFSRRHYKYKGEDVVDRIKLEKLSDYASKKYGSSPARGRTSQVVIGGRDRIFLVENDETPETKEGAITRAYNAFLSHYQLEQGTFYFLDKEEKTPDSWWVTENELIRVIKKADILTTAAAWRKQNRKEAGTRRATGKVKYMVVNNDPEDKKVDGTYMQGIEYTDIEKGIDYLTMQDLVTYGVVRNVSTHPREILYPIKNLLDFFDYTGEVLILDNGKKEETMVKRTKATPLTFDYLALKKHTKAAQNRAYIDNVNSQASWVELLKRYVGESNFNNLADPRFQELLKEDGPKGEVMSKEQYTKMRNFITSLGSHGGNEYTSTHQRELNELKNTWREMGSYYWVARQTEGTRSKTEQLKNAYESYISINARQSNAKLVVQVFNTIYEDYLTPRQKML